MTKIFEKISYYFGFNLNFYNSKLVINTLSSVAPKKFFNCQISDIGCGDGTNTLLLAKSLKAKSVAGYEINPSLASTARSKGIIVYSPHDDYNLKGELGILWGVAHHFNKPTEEIEKYIKNFKLFIIREPTDYLRLFEAGKRYKESEMTKFIAKATNNCGKKFTKFMVPEGKSVLYFIQ